MSEIMATQTIPVVLHLSSEPCALLEGLLLSDSLGNARHIIVSMTTPDRSIQQIPERDMAISIEELIHLAADKAVVVPTFELMSLNDIDTLSANSVHLIIDLSSDLWWASDARAADPYFRSKLQKVVAPGSLCLATFAPIINNWIRLIKGTCKLQHEFTDTKNKTAEGYRVYKLDLFPVFGTELEGNCR
jgi:hypothetical protein